jgi:two-component system response regulator AtoC
MSREIEQDSDSFVRSLNPEVLTLERIMGEIAGTGIPVLLAGESGTGKEVFALEIHRQSARRDDPLVKIRRASLGADSLPGWLQPAASSGNGGESAGTVFFDEVSELDSACQRCLLQALLDGDGFPREPFLAARRTFSTLVVRGSAKNESPGTEESAGAP